MRGPCTSSSTPRPCATPRRWEFPKGGIEPGETTRQTAAREFQEETALGRLVLPRRLRTRLSYTYIRRGRKIVKTVSYYLVEVRDPSTLACSAEHVADPAGHWHHWGTIEEIAACSITAKIRQVFAEADAMAPRRRGPPSFPPRTRVAPTSSGVSWGRVSGCGRGRIAYDATLKGGGSIMPEEIGGPSNPTRPHPGFFLVLDGPDGGGKTTQASRLADWLRGAASTSLPAATPAARRWATGSVRS